MDDLKELELDIEKLKLQLERLKSHVESEGGTQSREWQRLRDEIRETDKKFNDIIYGDGNGKKGILIKLDRLEQFKTAFYWVIGIVAAILIKMLIDFLKK